MRLGKRKRRDGRGSVNEAGSSHRLSEEAPDAAWLEEEAGRRREAFERERAQERVARFARRELQAPSVRLSAVERSILTTSTTAAAGTSPGRGKPDSKPPPFADSLEIGGAHPAEAKRLLRIVTDSIRKLETLVDEHQLGSANRTEMFSSDLDKLLRDKYRGYSPEDVSLLEPSLGSPAAVRKSRANMDPPLHRETGDEMPRRRR